MLVGLPRALSRCFSSYSASAASVAPNRKSGAGLLPFSYRLQADSLGDLDAESQRLLEGSTSPQQASARVTEARRRQIRLRPGTVLAREWEGQMQRVAVMADGLCAHGVRSAGDGRV